MSNAEKKTTHIILFVTAFTVLLWAEFLYQTIIKIHPSAANHLFNFIISHKVTLEKAGQFVDAFGVINSLFSALTLAGLIFTIWIQQQEIKNRNNEVILEKIEDRFLKLLDTHNKIIESIICIVHGHTYSGRAALRKEHGRLCAYFLKDKERELTDLKRDAANLGDLETKDIDSIAKCYFENRTLFEAIALPPNTVTKEYNSFYRAEKPNIGHYFSSLFGVIEYMEEQLNKNNLSSTEIEKLRAYAMHVIQNQLSTQERVLIFYHCTSAHGAHYKPLLVKYQLTKDLSDEDYIHPEHKKLLEQAA